MSTPRQAPDLPLAAYFRYVRRHAALLIVSALVGAVLGAVLGHRLTAYVGTAAVLVPPANLDPQGVPISNAVPSTDKDALTPDTEAQIATSSAVIQKIRAATGLTAPVDVLSKRLFIDAPTNTRVLTVSFRARLPANARKGAQVAAEAYLTARKDLLEDRRVSDLAALGSQITGLRRAYLSVSETAGFGTAAQRADTLRANSLNTKIRSLRRVANRMRADPVDAGDLIRPAQVSALRPRTSREIPLTSGLLGGLLIGLFIARVVPRRLVVTTGAARAVSPEVDVLALPRARRQGLAQLSRWSLGRHRATRPGPAVRRLRNHVVADGGGVTVLCGPVRPAAAAALTMGLARLLARIGDPVAVVVDDQPETLRSLRLRPEQLRAATIAFDATQDPDATSGGVTAYRLPTGLDAAETVTALTESHRHVIVGIPGSPDAANCAVARAADRVLLCTERRRSRIADLRVVVRRLRLVRARVTLGLLIGADRARPWRETGDLF